jgi:hypothetical protein
MSPSPERAICDLHSRDTELCGVFDVETQTFCSEPQYSFRRCYKHWASLKQTSGGEGTSLFHALKRLDFEQRERALDMLDSNTKVRRPSWTYEGKEDELIAAQEQNNEQHRQ